MEVAEAEDCAEVWHYLGDAYDDVRALLACEVVELEIYL